MRYFPAATIALTVACAARAHSEPVRASLPDFACATGAYGVRLPPKLSALRLLGKLEQEKVVSTEQWDDYQTVELILRFKGLSLQVITFTNDPERYNVAAMAIESPRWVVSPLQVGQPSAAPLTRMGVRAGITDGAWRFEGESDALYVEARRGKIHRVFYECYTG
jgi:hypothetical protein